MANEWTDFRVLGQRIKLSWESSAIKIFLSLIIILAFFCLTFGFLIDPMIPFFSFILIFLLAGIYLCFLLPKKPEIFQKGDVWLAYQKELLGDKGKGLLESSIEGEIVQPILESRINVVKASLTKEVKK